MIWRERPGARKPVQKSTTEEDRQKVLGDDPISVRPKVHFLAETRKIRPAGRGLPACWGWKGFSVRPLRYKILPRKDELDRFFSTWRPKRAFRVASKSPRLAIFEKKSCALSAVPGLVCVVLLSSWCPCQDT
jgi:hypothetical protein